MTERTPRAISAAEGYLAHARECPICRDWDKSPTDCPEANRLFDLLRAEFEGAGDPKPREIYKSVPKRYRVIDRKPKGADDV